ncbi:hypothetical protein A8L44_18205 [Bacillus sp. FJAT-27986]|nr:hypothetical protein A8L44_18205 [Bacillus sp. FJAT-27986]
MNNRRKGPEEINGLFNLSHIPYTVPEYGRFFGNIVPFVLQNMIKFLISTVEGIVEFLEEDN